MSDTVNSGQIEASSLGLVQRLHGRTLYAPNSVFSEEWRILVS